MSNFEVTEVIVSSVDLDWKIVYLRKRLKIIVDDMICVISNFIISTFIISRNIIENLLFPFEIIKAKEVKLYF